VTATVPRQDESRSDSCERILFVDDDEGVLHGLQRAHGRTRDTTVAHGPTAALQQLRGGTTFAVIVCDLRMPEMDGIRLLSQAARLQPDCVRILLTGHADLDAAMKAVNEGHVFRFLTKPCPQQAMATALDAAIGQHRLQVAERELTEQTLNGAVTVMTEVLSLANPAAFGRAGRIRRYVDALADAFDVDGRWELDLAALLAQLGSVVLPPDTITRVLCGEPLGRAEQELYDGYPSVSARLLAHVPRLERVAALIAGLAEGDQDDPGSGTDDPILDRDRSLLRAASAFDLVITRGKGIQAASREAELAGGRHGPRIAEVLAGTRVARDEMRLDLVEVTQLNHYMILDQDVTAASGLLLVTRGTEVTAPVIERLRAFAATVGVAEPLRVLRPQ